MTRRTVAAASAALAALATLCACTSTDATTSPAVKTTTQPSDDPTTAAPGKPIDITQIPAETPLEPAKYSMPLLLGNGPMRAIIDVPEGYAAWPGGRVIGSAVDEAKPDDYGDIAFWGRVTQVDTDPCLGGRHVTAGTTVHDLAALLVAQRHMETTPPVPVTVGGYHGTYLKVTAPADIDRCRQGRVTVLTGGDSWLQADAPGTAFHEWILNVGGQRVVAGARIFPDFSKRAELVAMVESAEFSEASTS
jgi:hypothetical protein